MDKIKSNEEFRSKLIGELNQCRKDPKTYSKKIESYIPYFKGKVLRLPNITGLMTNEGESAFQEAADYLMSLQPVPSFKYNPGLTHIAHDYMKEIQKYEDLNDAKKINLKSMIAKYGKCIGEFKLSTDFGSSSPELIAINLLVDDGDKEREMRNVIFDKSYIDVGVSTGNHSTYNKCTVIFFAKKFISKNDDNYAEYANEEEKKEDYENEDFDLPEGVERIEKQEKVITENGNKKKIVKTVYYNSDGTQNIKTIKKDIYE